MSQQAAFDFSDSRALRDHGLKTVTSNAGPWIDQAYRALCTLPTGWTGLFEEARAHVLSRGVEEPHHPNAWGALSSKAIKRGVLTYTGRWLQSKSAASHAHHYREVKRVG